MRWLKCFLGFHCRPHWLAKDWNFIWSCDRCSTLVVMPLLKERKR